MLEKVNRTENRADFFSEIRRDPNGCRTPCVNLPRINNYQDRAYILQNPMRIGIYFSSLDLCLQKALTHFDSFC